MLTSHLKVGVLELCLDVILKLKRSRSSVLVVWPSYFLMFTTELVYLLSTPLWCLVMTFCAILQNSFSVLFVALYSAHLTVLRQFWMWFFNQLSPTQHILPMGLSAVLLFVMFNQIVTVAQSVLAMNSCVVKCL